MKILNLKIKVIFNNKSEMNITCKSEIMLDSDQEITKYLYVKDGLLNIKNIVTIDNKPSYFENYSISMINIFNYCYNLIVEN